MSDRGNVQRPAKPKSAPAPDRRVEQRPVPDSPAADEQRTQYAWCSHCLGTREIRSSSGTCVTCGFNARSIVQR